MVEKKKKKNRRASSPRGRSRKKEGRKERGGGKVRRGPSSVWCLGKNVRGKKIKEGVDLSRN